MDQMILEYSKDITNNDIYFMEVISDKIIINDNYDGVLILDSDLNVLKRIKLLDDMSIDMSFVNNNEILLYCYENRSLIYIDAISYTYNIIELNKDLEDKVFASLFEWQEKNVVLLADNGETYVHINLLDNLVQVIQKDVIDQLGFSIQDYWSKLNKSIIHKVYPQKNKAIVESEDLIKVIDYKNDTEAILKVNPFEAKPFYYYDIEIMVDYVAQISEKQVSVLYNGKNVVLYPGNQHYSFLRGKFINVDKKRYLLLLSGSNSDSKKSTIQKYSF